MPLTKGGIGSSNIEFKRMHLTDPCPLTETLNEVLTPDHLNRVKFVSITTNSYDEAKRMMIYFLNDGTTIILLMEDLLIMSTNELKYIHYLL